MALGGGIFGGVIRIDAIRIRLSDTRIRHPAGSLHKRAWRRAHVSRQTWMLPEATRRGIRRKLILPIGTLTLLFNAHMPNMDSDTY